MSPHLIAIDMLMINQQMSFATQKWPPFEQMMTAQEADVKDHTWYQLSQQPKSHPYYKVMEELTQPSPRARQQAQPVDKGKGKELCMDGDQGIQVPDGPTDPVTWNTGVEMQRPGNEDHQGMEKAWGHSQSQDGWPAAKCVNAGD
ncbi:hypothetical protein BKA82DRAFT_26284 [Pisolithus tinctorius]|uniref:Uncharacterized protein n=1 Tax=Pisolithus tinctorius Marx 270 TaxID=870435 RepID=A0A0C3K4D5_PISTI|nr:hypothetical protein BKA82DRAFT_26284 [Pisolithus tinctorius]KIO04422.1 hypothetical protein M404DRAFT_26284 [Pisolithus tinctorius Marx 270]